MVKKELIGTTKPDHNNSHKHFFKCPGCGYTHCFTPEPGSYNNNPFKPTLEHPVIIPGHLALFHCHSTIKNGEITFNKDCTHEHAGYTYPLQPVND